MNRKCAFKDNVRPDVTCGHTTETRELMTKLLDACGTNDSLD